MRASKVISVSLPPDMTKEVQEMAKDERRSVSELLREAFRQYAAGKALQDVRKEAGRVAKKKGIKPGDIEQVIREGRDRR